MDNLADLRDEQRFVEPFGGAVGFGGRLAILSTKMWSGERLGLYTFDDKEYYSRSADRKYREGYN